MRVIIFVTGIIFSLSSAAFAQAGAAAGLDETQALGRALLNQHCAICHLPPQPGATTYGPRLNGETLGGEAVALRDFIGNGDARMPGFKYEFEQREIDAIVAYLLTLKAPQVERAPTPRDRQ